MAAPSASPAFGMTAPSASSFGFGQSPAPKTIHTLAAKGDIEGVRALIDSNPTGVNERDMV